MDDFQKFKHLLEYFVAHLESVEKNKDTTTVGYNTYIEPIDKKDIKWSGQGCHGGKIQKLIEKWDSYSNGCKICINVTGGTPTRFQNKGCYLNWKDTGNIKIDVRPKWENNHIVKLYLSIEMDNTDKKQRAKPEYEKAIEKLGLYEKTIEELGLFDDKEDPNSTLIDFFKKYQELLEYHNSIQRKYSMNEQIQNYINLLESNHNIILTGAPGTGKTYLAKQIAKGMGCTEDEIGFVQFHPSFDYTDFVEGLRPIQDENGNVGFERRDGVFKEFCAKALEQETIMPNDFDQAWDKLISDIREKLSNDQLTKIDKWYYGLSAKDSLKYTSVNTPSKYSFTITKKNVYDTYCGLQARPSGAYHNDMLKIIDYLKDKYALSDYKPVVNSQSTNRPFVFIIDEINRGEISKIFGELFFSIDPGYRGENGRVQTQYQNLVEDGDVFQKGFFVPENVYIIGTMNDIDRSVESMDFAFRRRFAFKEIKADENVGMLDNLAQKDEAIKRMKSLNGAIVRIEGLSSAYHIGASYFLKLKNYNGDFGKLWDYHLEGLLREYMRGMSDVENKIEKLHTAYNNESASDNGQQS